MVYQDKQYLASFVRRAVMQIMMDHGIEDYRDHESYLPNGGNIGEYLMQYIGLHDRRGKEIYESDIIKIEDATAKVVFWGRPPAFGLDYYHNEEKWCDDWNLSDDSDRMEIIGNLYENPDLLSHT